MIPLLIADSGGTKTDWCFVDSTNSKHFFTTESYHPENWSKDFEERIQKFWDEHLDFRVAQLYFFCAGCLKDEKANELAQLFSRIGFSNITVKSDLHAAGLALYGKSNGFCAIMGTGSVFFEWRNQNVVSIVGGKGHEIGDEGSGYFFGKLVVEAFENKTLSIEQKRIFEKEIAPNEISDAIRNKTTKNVFSSLAKRFASYSGAFDDFHLQNIELFFDDVWKSNEPLQVSIVGGYFDANSERFIPHLSKKGIHIQNFIDRPIDSLVDYFVRSGE